MIIIFLFLYGFAILALFIAGIVTIVVKSSNNQSTKLGIRMLITSVVMLVIGGGACAALLAGG